jgi:hypothetical protein
MSYTGKFKLPYRIVNGVKQFVTIEDWAETSLDPTNLALFRTAKTREDALWAAEKASGNVTVTSLDVNGNPLPAAPITINTWPQVMSISINGAPAKTGLFNSDFTSNLAPMAPNDMAGTHTVVNHTSGSTYQKFFDSTGKFISMTSPVPIESTVTAPVVAMGEYIWNTAPVKPDEEYSAFTEQYRTDPGLTWDSNSEQFSKN